MTQVEKHGALPYVALLLAVLFLALVGYVGYALYPRFDLPAVTGAGLLLLAAAAGLASFFSPCSFPLLATLLARQVRELPRREAWSRLLRFATALAAGATLFLLLAGAALAFGVAPLFQRVTFTSTAGRLIRAGTGVLLLLLGLLQWRGISPGSDAVYAVAHPLVQAQARLRRERPMLAFGLFGFSYILASFGWTGPILAGLAGHALASGGSSAAFIAFVVTAATMAILMFGLAVLVGAAQERVVAALKSGTSRVKRWSGLVLAGVGMCLIVLAIWADFFARFFPV